MSGQATNINQILGGNRWGLIGDPTTGSGADMVSLGRLVSVSVGPQLFRQVIKNEMDQTLQVGGHLSDWNIQIEMQRQSAAILAAMINEATDETTSISFKSSYVTITPATLCLVRDEIKNNGTPLTDLTTYWFPKVVSTDVGAMVERITNGVDQPTYTVTFTVVFAETDQDDQDIADDYEMGWRGSPVDAINEGTPTAWSLPDVANW